MKAKTLLIGLMAAFATVLAACGGGNSSSKVPSIPSSSVPTPSPSTPTPSVSTPTPSTPTPSVSTTTPSTPTPSVSTPAVSTPDVDPDPTPDPIVPDTPVEGNLFVATGWEEADELQADVNEGANIVYWADTGWVSSTVTATTSVENGVFTIDGTQVNGHCWHGLQVFINVPNNAAGDTYEVSFNLNSSVAGKITFNGTAVDLVVGDNELSSTVTVSKTTTWDGKEFITAPISIQFGTESGNQDTNKALQNGEYSFSNIVILKTENTDNPGETPVDPNPDPEVPGNLSFDLIKTEFGEEAAILNDTNFIGQSIAYWNDQNWVGSYVTVNASVSNGVATYEVASTPWNPDAYIWYGFQLFAVPTGYVAGATYKVSFDLNSSVAGKITASGQTLEVANGDNHFDIIVTPEANKAPLSIIMGVDGDNANNAIMQNATYKISNLAFENYAEGTENPNPENPTPDPEPENPTPDNPVVPEPGDLKGLFTVIANATVGAANNYTIKWNDAAYAVTQQASITDCTVSPGIVVNLEYFTVAGDGVTFNIITGADVGRVVSIVLHTEQGDYKVSMRLDGNTYADYTVEKVDCTHSSSSEPSEPVDIFEQTSGQFNYSGEAALGTKELSFWNWRVQENLETPERGEDKNTVATYDAETKTFHYSSYAEAGEWWHDQFFYKSGESGQVKVSFTITVAGFEGETGEITINGQVYTVTNGQALDVEYNTFNATTISIQLGKAGGTNLTGYLNVTISGMSIIK